MLSEEEQHNRMHLAVEQTAEVLLTHLQTRSALNTRAIEYEAVEEYILWGMLEDYLMHWAQAKLKRHEEACSP